MRITDVQVTIIEQELSAPFWTSHSPITHVREVVAWIHTDDGLVGVGEAKTATPARTARVILDGFKPFLTGSDPLETERLWERMFSLTWDDTGHARGWSRDEVLNAIAAVDIALWDLKGKAAEMPVYQLLGGENRPALLFDARVFLRRYVYQRTGGPPRHIRGPTGTGRGQSEDRPFR